MKLLTPTPGATLMCTASLALALSLQACSPQGGAGAMPTAGSAAGNTQHSASVTLEQARALLEKQEAVVFDIREPQEHAQGVAAGVRLLPSSQLPQRMQEIPTNTPVLLLCNTQNRSRRAMEMLQDAGWRNVRYVQGGMSAWVERGWPVVAPQ